MAIVSAIVGAVTLARIAPILEFQILFWLRRAITSCGLSDSDKDSA
jgi:hypothetical protein